MSEDDIKDVHSKICCKTPGLADKEDPANKYHKQRRTESI